MCFICACVNLFLSLMCLVGAYEFGLHLCVFVYLLVCLFVCVSGWTQVLSELDIVVPLQLLVGMFSDGVNSVKELANQRKAHVSNLTGENTEARRVRCHTMSSTPMQNNLNAKEKSSYRSYISFLSMNSNRRTNELRRDTVYIHNRRILVI